MEGRGNGKGKGKGKEEGVVERWGVRGGVGLFL